MTVRWNEALKHFTVLTLEITEKMQALSRAVHVLFQD